MAHNDRTPAVGTARALVDDVCFPADHSRDTAPHLHLQASRLTQRFKFSPALASAIAELAFDRPENWRRA